MNEKNGDKFHLS